MKTTVNLHTFQKAFMDLRPENFTRNGIKRMYEYITELEEETDTQIELDVIAICVDFSEYENITECKKDYNIETLEELREQTDVIMIDNESFLMRNY